jgi:serine protease Do
MRASAALLLLLLSALSLGAEEDWGKKITAKINRIFQERREAVVRIEAFDRQGRLCGTGFFADPAGTIYTLNYIVDQADEIFVIFNNRKIPAKLLVSDPRSGIALLKADCESPFIPIGNGSKLSVATPILAIGFPLNSQATPTFGLLAGFDRQFLGHHFMTTHLRANLPVEPGFGGAPVLDLDGKAVGIVFSGIGGGGACYALPIEAAEKIRTDYIRFGEPRHGWVGVSVEEQPGTIQGSNVRISALAPDTPAAQSGLLDGDVLIQVGDRKVAHTEDVIDASFFLTAGDDVPITVIRDGKTVVVSVQASRHPITETPLFPGGSMNALHALMPEPSPENLKLE